MADSSSGSLLSYLRSLGADTGYLREALRLLIELLMELEVSASIAATPYERKAGRKAYRNGYRVRSLRTSLGEISVRIPKLRKGTYYPSFIDLLPDAEELLFVLSQDVRSSNLEALLRRLDLPSVHQSQIADICEQLDNLIYEFRQRPLKSVYPYLWLDVLDLPVANLSVALAVGIRGNGLREILGFEIVSEPLNQALWSAFLRRLVWRGLAGVELIIAGAHDGLETAARSVLGDLAWQPHRKDLPVKLPALVSAIATQRLDTGISNTNAPRAMLMSLPLGELVSIAALVALKKALSQPGDAVGYALDGTTLMRLVGAVLLVMDSEWQMQTGRHELNQPLAA